MEEPILHPSVAAYPVGRVVFREAAPADQPDRADEAALLLAQLQEELASRHAEALERIARTVRRMRRSGRRARPVPQAAFDAALELIEALARGALEREAA
jgi:hypothetical protein